jgi:hypothetical protein
MNWKPHLPEIFLGISLAMIAVEAALSRSAVIEAHYKSSDTWASLGMQAGNIVMNLAMAGGVFAEALGVVFGPPGWRADGQGLTSKNIRSGWEARYGR